MPDLQLSKRGRRDLATRHRTTMAEAVLEEADDLAQVEGTYVAEVVVGRRGADGEACYDGRIVTCTATGVIVGLKKIERYPCMVVCQQAMSHLDMYNNQSSIWEVQARHAKHNSPED